MISTLPVESLSSIEQRVACRQAQLQQLAVFYHESFPSPSVLVCNGLEDSGKLESVIATLELREIDHVVVRSKECLSQRHLLGKIFASCLRETEQENFTSQYDRVDSINALLENLRKLLEGRRRRIVLILDGIDEQKGASATLLSALARIGDVVPSLSVVLITSSPKPLSLHRAGIPHVQFPPYSRAEAIQILLKSPPALLPESLPSYTPDIEKEHLLRIYRQFITTVYDTLNSYTNNSVRTFRQTCEKLWPRFIWPLVSGALPRGQGSKADSTKWDFAQLLRENRSLFQAQGELALQYQIRPGEVAATTSEELMRQKEQADNQGSQSTGKLGNLTTNPLEQEHSSTQLQPPLLKHFTTLVLLAAYLASHSLQKHDIVLFSRLSSSSTSKRKYLNRSRSGGISKTPTKSPGRSKSGNPGDGEGGGTPSRKTKAKEIAAAEATTPKKERADRSMRAIFDRTSNIAKPFTLERLIAILRAIHPDGIPQRRGTSDRVYLELSELERLKLVVRASGGGSGEGNGGSGGIRGGDLPTDEIMEEKWKVNVGREWVQGMGRVWGVGLEGWEID